MKRHPWKLASLLLVPLALGAYIVERNSWRPKIIVPNGLLSEIKFSPDGRTLVSRNTSGEDFDIGDALLFDVTTRSLITKIKKAEALCYLENGQYLSVFCPSLSGDHLEGHGKIISVLDGKTKLVTPRFFAPYDVLSDGKTLVGNKTINNSDVYAWNFYMKKVPQLYFPATQLLSKTASIHGFLADKSTFVVEDFAIPNKGKGTLQFWDSNARKLRFSILERDTLQEGRSYMLAGHSSSLAGLFAFYNFDRVEIWNYKTGHMRNSFPITIPNEEGRASSNLYLDKCALSPDGTVMAGSGVMGRSTVLWDTRSGKALREWNFSNNEYITDLEFSPDSRTLATAHGDGTVKLWRIK